MRRPGGSSKRPKRFSTILLADAKAPTEIKLPAAVEQKILAVLEALNPEDFSCLRELK